MNIFKWIWFSSILFFCFKIPSSQAITLSFLPDYTPQHLPVSHSFSPLLSKKKIIFSSVLLCQHLGVGIRICYFKCWANKYFPRVAHRESVHRKFIQLESFISNWTSGCNYVKPTALSGPSPAQQKDTSISFENSLPENSETWIKVRRKHELHSRAVEESSLEMWKVLSHTKVPLKTGQAEKTWGAG